MYLLGLNCWFIFTHQQYYLTVVREEGCLTEFPLMASFLQTADWHNSCFSSGALCLHPWKMCKHIVGSRALFSDQRLASWDFFLHLINEIFEFSFEPRTFHNAYCIIKCLCFMLMPVQFPSLLKDSFSYGMESCGSEMHKPYSRLAPDLGKVTTYDFSSSTSWSHGYITVGLENSQERQVQFLPRATILAGNRRLPLII
uniref:Uncharacterized protein n=1 Tax=Sphaerodactylus townsendi TaxID=933632 RepID=A0ACB8GCB6_9SAUR